MNATLENMSINELVSLQSRIRKGKVKAYQGAKGDLVKVLAGKRLELRQFSVLYRQAERAGLVLSITDLKAKCGTQYSWVLYRVRHNGEQAIERIEYSQSLSYLRERLTAWKEAGKVWPSVADHA